MASRFEDTDGLARRIPLDLERTFPGPSELAKRMRTFDWSATPLGPLHRWPRSLLNYVAMLLELPTPAIVFWGAEHIQLYNDGYSTIMGPRHPKFLAATYRECWPDTYPTIHPWMEKVLRTGEVVRVDGEHIPLTRYGFTEEAFFSFTFSPLRDDDGEIAGVLQPVFEVTDAVLADRRTRTLAALTPKADSVNAADDVLAALSTNRKDIPFFVVYLWDEAKRTLDTMAGGDGAAIGHASLSRLAEAARETWEAGIARTVDGEGDWLAPRLGPWPEPVRTVVSVPLRRSRSDPHRGVIVLGLSPRLRYDDKYRVFVESVARHVAIAIDTKRALHEAQSANRAKDVFLAMLGHELRNPLAPMATALQLMRLRGSESRELEVLERQVAHLTALVDDLLDIGRITSGKVDLRRQRVELRTVVLRAIETASHMLERRKHDLVVDVPPTGLPVHVDPQRMAQVFANLLTNAAKYSEPDSRIQIEARPLADRVRLVVRDEGVGIAKEMLDAIFDMFVQHPQTLDRSTGGLGLGLTIARSLVEMHSGSIRARSAGPGRGSELIVELPLATRAAAETTVGAMAPASRRAVRRSRRVLVVDDNEDAVDMLRELLRQVGHVVEVAYDGPTALEAAATFRPEVAIVDIGLPVMDGYELAGRLRALANGAWNLRLVAATGYGQDTDRRRAEEAGFLRHLVKPIDFDVLSDVLEAL